MLSRQSAGGDPGHVTIGVSCDDDDDDDNDDDEFDDDHHRSVCERSETTAKWTLQLGEHTSDERCTCQLSVGRSIAVQ